jgi:hypothetical protein
MARYWTKHASSSEAWRMEVITAMIGSLAATHLLTRIILAGQDENDRAGQ